MGKKKMLIVDDEEDFGFLMKSFFSKGYDVHIALTLSEGMRLLKEEDPDVVFFGKGTGRDKKPWGINIGNVFFKDFVMTIDYKKKLIMLERP